MPDEDRAAYLEELIVRRELASNFVAYNPAYDRLDGLPDWARKTLDKHAGDPTKQAVAGERVSTCRTIEEEFRCEKWHAEKTCK